MADQPPPPRPEKPPLRPREDDAKRPIVPPAAKPAIAVPPVVPKVVAARPVVPPVVPKAVPPKAIAAPATPTPPAKPPTPAKPAEPQRPRALVDAGGETAEPVPAEAVARSRPRDPAASTAAVGMPASVLEAKPPAPRIAPAPKAPPPAPKAPTPPPMPAPAASTAVPAPAAPVPAAVVPAAAVPAGAVPAVAVKTLQIARPTGPDPMIGRVVARCKIEERIGEGKTSVVYRATHTALGMKVAVKILHPEVLQFPEIVQKFENEARAIARLDHANVLKIYDVATEGDVHGIVMELLEGETVLDLLDREERLPAVDSLRIIRQAAAGLEAAHAKKIIHRDVKPQNLVVLPDGTVKLVDFGLATAPDSDMAASRIGTPHYMAPEVCEAKPAEPESDVYSLGISLYHCLVGSPPYAGKTVKEILAAHIEGKPLHPEWRAPGIPKPLCDLVADMTKRDPLTRMTMHDVIDVVDKIGGEELAASPRLSARRSRVRSKSSAPVAAIVGGIVLVIGILAMVLAKGGPSPKPPPPGAGRETGEATAEPGATSPTAGTAGTSSPTPSTPTPPPVVAPTPADPPPPPPETEAERKAREAEEAAARKRQAETAFKEVEEFARLHETDKVGVVRMYRNVASGFKGTESAKEARRRADLIDKGEMHPNPDKTFTPPDRVAEATAKWEAVRAKVDAALTAGDYAEGESLIPDAVDDPKGQLSEELAFWRRLAADCRGFVAALKHFAPDLKGKDRDLPTPKGVGHVTDANEGGLKVEVGGAVLDFRWDEIAAKDLLQLAARAFKNKGDEYGSMIVSFAFVHRLRDEFWKYAVGRALSGDAATHVSRALARAETRFPK